MSLIHADARAIPLADGCVQCVVTSPPYFGLRDYGTAAQIGLEPTPDAYVQQIVAVFREVRRVLKDDGVLWLNLGSSYFGSTMTGGNSGFNASGGKDGFKQARQFTRRASCDETPATQSRQPGRAPACDTDGTALPDSTASDFACSDLCDGCLTDWMTHRDRSAGTSRQTQQCEPPPSQTVRDSERLDSASASPVASLLDAQASNTLESWRQHRGACSRCDSRASSLAAVHSSSGDVLPFARMTWLDYTSRLKQKDLIPTPWLVAMALQADGWYLRSDIIWSKPNPMPESVTDRPTKIHEYLFLLTKSERYYFDAEAIKEPAAMGTDLGLLRGRQHVGQVDGVAWHAPSIARRQAAGIDSRSAGDGFRNKRTVWTVATAPYSGAHFATMPEKLVEPCILAGSRLGDRVLDPFIGSGTVGAVAERLGRRWVGLDLNPAYHQLARKRTSQRGLRFDGAVA